MALGSDETLRETQWNMLVVLQRGPNRSARTSAGVARHGAS